MIEEIVLGDFSHSPNFTIEEAENFYSKKDGVEVRYVCSSDLNGEAFSCDIFYRETPHKKFGNRYFGIFKHSGGGGSVFITDADKIEDFIFSMILDDDGVFHYSSHRHHYKKVGRVMIDGGRSYTRTNGYVHSFVVRDGKFVVVNDKEV